MALFYRTEVGHISVLKIRWPCRFLGCLLPGTCLSIAEYSSVTGLFCKFPMPDSVFEVVNNAPIFHKTSFLGYIRCAGSG